MTNDKYISQIAVVGDDRKFVGALIVLDPGTLAIYAAQKGITYESHEDLIRKDEIIRMIGSHVEEHQNDLSSHEKIKRFILLSSPFSIEGGELTDTLKLRRPVILKKYATEIESMYAE